MSREKLSGNMILKIKRMDRKTLFIYLKNGDVLKVSSEMVDYDNCELFVRKID